MYADVSGSPGVAASYDVNTGTLVLRASSGEPLSSFEAALRTVRYSNEDDDPDSTLRIVAFQCEDQFAVASNTVNAEVTVIPVNDSPVIDLSGNSDPNDSSEAVTWTEQIGRAHV